MNVDFGTATVTALVVSMSVGSNSYTFGAGSTPISPIASGYGFGGSATVVNASDCSSPCTGTFSGSFFSARRGAGVAFKFDGSQTVTGSVAFKELTARECSPAGSSLAGILWPAITPPPRGGVTFPIGAEPVVASEGSGRPTVQQLAVLADFLWQASPFFRTHGIRRVVARNTAGPTRSGSAYRFSGRHSTGR